MHRFCISSCDVYAVFFFYITATFHVFVAIFFLLYSNFDARLWISYSIWVFSWVFVSLGDKWAVEREKKHNPSHCQRSMKKYEIYFDWIVIESIASVSMMKIIIQMSWNFETLGSWTLCKCSKEKRNLLNYSNHSTSIVWTRSEENVFYSIFEWQAACWETFSVWKIFENWIQWIRNMDSNFFAVNKSIASH